MHTGNAEAVEGLEGSFFRSLISQSRRVAFSAKTTHQEELGLLLTIDASFV